MLVIDLISFYETGNIIIMCMLVAVFSDLNPVRVGKVL
jgi:hypothetical protein